MERHDWIGIGGFIVLILIFIVALIVLYRSTFEYNIVANQSYGVGYETGINDTFDFMVDNTRNCSLLYVNHSGQIYQFVDLSCIGAR